MPAVTFYENKSHALKTDKDTLSEYWSIRAENLSFTFFKVPPHSEFKKHKHISEQITYVLKGELFFEAEGNIFCLKKGDSIVITSNAEHRVWTTDQGAEAIDSWSPPADKY